MSKNQSNVVILNYNGEATPDIHKQISSDIFPMTKGNIGYAQSSGGIKKQYTTQRNRLFIADMPKFQKTPIEQRQDLLTRFFENMEKASENHEGITTCTLLYFDQEGGTIAGMGDCPAGIMETEPLTQKETGENFYTTKYTALFVPHTVLNTLETLRIYRSEKEEDLKNFEKDGIQHKDNRHLRVKVTRGFGAKNFPFLNRKNAKTPEFINIASKSKDRFLIMHTISLGEFQDFENGFDTLAFPQKDLDSYPADWSYEQNIAHQLIARRLHRSVQKHEPSPCVSAVCISSESMQTVNHGYLIGVFNSHINDESLNAVTDALQESVDAINN